MIKFRFFIIDKYMYGSFGRMGMAIYGTRTITYALDERLRARGGIDEEEVEKVLHLGLLCSYPDPSARPSMR